MMPHPFLWLGPRGALWLELTGDGGRETFLRVCDHLCREFRGVVTERYPERNVDSSDKEYWWLEIDGSSLLLMRKSRLGTALGGSAPQDLAVLTRLADALGAPRVGWRWRIYRLTSWLGRGRGNP